MSRGRGRFLLVAVFSGIVFTQLRGVPLPAALLLTLLLVPLPVVLIAQAGHSAAIAAMPRASIYRETMISLWLLAVIAAAVSWLSGFGAADLGLVPLAPLPLIGWSVAATAAGAATMFAASALGRRENELVAHLLPATAGEKAAFAAVSLTAGVCEEFVFRGFIFFTLLLATGSALIAFVVSSGAFGVVHAYQQPGGAIRAGVLGALLAVPVLVTGSILPSVIAHAAIDLLAGFVFRERLLRG